MPSVIGQDTTASGYDPGLATPPMTFGVWGDSGNGTGVVGSSSNAAPAPATVGGAGVYGLNNAAGGLGVRGEADHQTGTAVLGTSSQGTGVAGRSDGAGAGVVGTSAQSAGVIGESQGSGPGVSGTSGQGAGVSGTSSSGVGVAAESTGGTALHARRPTTGGTVIEARLATPQRAGEFTGDVLVSGAVGVGTKLGVGASSPVSPLGVRGAGPAQELVSFEDGTGTTKWHVNQNLNGNPGLNIAETGVADGRLYLAAGGRVGLGTTAPTHPLHVSATRGVRQNEMYLSGDSGWSSLSYNAHHNDQNNNWVFPDPTRTAVTVEMDDHSNVPRFQVWTTTPTNKIGWQLRLAVDGSTGAVTVPSGRLGVMTSSPAFELDVNGTACAKQFCNPSDVRVKRDITPVSDVLSRLAAIRPVSYRPADRVQTAPRQLGVIAQEVEPEFPELVLDMAADGLKAVDYSGLVGVLVGAVNELSARNAELSDRLATVERLCRPVCESGAGDAG
jgi:hypothetical protein